jgi:cellulose biosynthesis protein BcsQ/tetratricopeptide (TPR) repeat protein
MVSRPAKGQIITFYSYKGGTGRSMALANVAWILASAGKRVLTLDWDLEAPGLHRYFYPFLVDKDLSSSDGLIDFVLKFATAAMDSKSISSKGPEAADLEWYKPYTNILRYASSLNWKFDNGGALDFIPAGRQGSSYSTRVNSFNWQNFYDLLGGGTLLELAKEKMRSEYDYVLIDSRTGVSDTSGICTVQMPDILVICFTLNNQSIEGATAVANAVHEQRSKSEGGIKIFPVAMRVENAEKIKLQKRKDYAKERFKLFPNSLPGEERDRYWGETPVIYVPYYAYEEILAAFGDNTEDRISVLAAAEQLTSYLTSGEVKKLVPTSEARRVDVLAVYEGGPKAVSPAEEQNRFADSIFDRLSAEDKERVHHVFTRLVRVAQPNEVGGDTLLRLRSRDIEPDAFSILRPLIDARLLELEQDGSSGTYMVKIAKASFVQDWKRLRGWINEDREFLLWRQRLHARLDEWERSNREASALLTGTPLREAEQWLDERTEELSNNETLFIKSSVEQRDKASAKTDQQPTAWFARRHPILVKSLPIIGGLILVAVLYGLYNSWQSEKSRTATQAREALQKKASVHNSLGLEDLRKNNFDSARDSFSTAIAIYGQYPDGYMNRGNTYRRLGDLDDAITDLTQAIKLNPNYPNPYYYRGLAHRSKRDKEAAARDFQQCLSLANDKYWILNAKLRIQQLREEVPITVFYDTYLDSSSYDEVGADLTQAGYKVEKRPSKSPARRYAIVRYRFDYNQGEGRDEADAEDIAELVNDSFVRHGQRVRVYIEPVYPSGFGQRTYLSDKVRIVVFLPAE